MGRPAFVVFAAAYFVLVGCTPAAAEEVAKAADPWWMALLSSEAVWNAVGGLLAILLAILTRTAWVQRIKAKVDAADKDAWSALEAGVLQTYYDEVKSLKESAKDKKITKEEAQNLRDIAISRAKDLATGPGKDLLLKMGRPVLDTMIERLVGKLKRENSTPA